MYELQHILLIDSFLSYITATSPIIRTTTNINGAINMSATTPTLTPNEALILQQVHEDGEDDLSTVALQLGMSRSYVASVVAHLKSKGLVVVNTNLDDLWIHLTTRGRQLVNYMWPETRSVMA